MKKAALMSRVSSDEQAKGYSLDVQLGSLKQYCERNDIAIAKTFREDHSAKTFDRPQFKAFLNYLKANKGAIDLLLFTTWDRFSRNTGEAYAMISKLRKLGVEPQATEQPLDLSIPENKAMLAFYLAFPEIENDRRSIKIRGGILGAWKAGRWTGAAPRGYKNSRDEQNKPLLIQDKNASIVRFAFQELLKGRSHMEVRMAMQKKGLNVSKSVFSDMIRNPVYASRIFIPAHEGNPARFQKAVHEPIVSEELFNKVQKLLTKKQINANKLNVVNRNEYFPLRGVLLCPSCGSHVTGSASKSRNGTYHRYYHCNHCHSLRLRADEANERVEEIYSEFHFRKNPNQLLNLIMLNKMHEKLGVRSQNAKSVEAEILKIENRLKNIRIKYADNEIPSAEYFEMKTEFEANLGKLKGQIQGNSIIEKDSILKLKDVLIRIPKLVDRYRKSDVHGKIRILGSTFPGKLILEPEKSRTASLNKAIELGLIFDAGFRNKKTGQLTKNLWLSGRVENTGVEPVTFYMPCRRSSQLS